MRLIDADKLKVEVKKALLFSGDFMAQASVAKVIDDAPTVDQWHYPSRGEYPKEGENLLCLVSENFDDYRIGRLGTDRLWWTNDGVEDDIVCWQYIMPPKEKG